MGELGDAGWEESGVPVCDDNLEVDAAGKAGGNRFRASGEGGQ